MARADPAEIAGGDRQGSRERAFRLLAATVVALFVTFAALAGVFFWYDNATREVMQVRETREGIGDLLQALGAAESAQRGYVLVADPRFLTEVEAARARAEDSVTAVELATKDNPQQQARIEALRTQMAKRMAVIDQTLDLARAGDRAGATSVIRRGEGVAAMAAAQRQLVALDQEEARLEAERLARARLIRILALMALVVFALLLSALLIKAIRDISLDREAEAEAGERLRELVRQRTLLLDEVNHRVKNSLQQIASVVRLQSRATEHDEVREALDKTLLRIMAVGRVHERLYKSGGEFGVFDAGAYAKTLAEELVQSMGREDVRLETEVESADLDMRHAAPIALILNELVTNALKYGCPQDRPGSITVRFRTDADHCRLSVSDQGDGLPDGFSAASRKSLGMRAIEALAKQLGGRLIVEVPKAGAAFTVEFPRSAS